MAEALSVFMDSTTVRAHQHAAGAPGKTAEQSALGRSRGGLTTSIQVAAVNEHQADAILITHYKSSDCAQFEPLYEALPEENILESAALDKGYDTNAIRERLALDGIEPVIPGRSKRVEPIVYDKIKYKERNRVERCFNKKSKTSVASPPATENTHSPSSPSSTSPPLSSPHEFGNTTQVKRSMDCLGCGRQSEA